MKDTIIKGTKNSRSIIGAASIPATWEQARAQLIQSGWPIDLGPLNAAGLTQKGDDLNKANLLKDATAALYGLTAAAVPDDVLAKARTLITAAQTSANGRARVVAGSYVGTGQKLTRDNPKTLNFGFKPLFVQITERLNGDSAEISTAQRMSEPTAMIYPNPVAGQISWDSNYNMKSFFGVTWSNTGISFFNKDVISRLNNSEYTYYYCAFG